jgi:hypothetical protein
LANSPEHTASSFAWESNYDLLHKPIFAEMLLFQERIFQKSSKCQKIFMKLATGLQSHKNDLSIASMIFI